MRQPSCFLHCLLLWLLAASSIAQACPRVAVMQYADDSHQRAFAAFRETLRLNAPALQSFTIEAPDTRTFNSHTVQNGLLTAYKQRSPVLGLSAAYAQAGALLALHSKPEQIGQQTAELVADFASGGAMPPPQPPRYFAVATHPNVARSLGITLDGAEMLTEVLARDEP